MSELNQQKNAVLWLRFLYPVWAVVGMFSLMYVPTELIVKNEAVQTVENITANEFLFRAGIAGSLITQLFSLVAVWFLYRLFYSSFREAVIITAVLSFIGVPISMLSDANQLVALEVLDNPEQAYQYLRQGSRGMIVATIFWGLWLFPLGYMIINSPLFPRVVGWLVVLGGVGYTLAAFGYFFGVEGVFLDVMNYLTFGEVLWMLWLTVFGAKWTALSVKNS
jgi:hypothetical protein